MFLSHVEPKLDLKHERWDRGGAYS